MPKSVRGTCHCGQPVRTKGRGASGIKLWDRVCWKCKEGGYRLYKKSYCEECGFVAIHQVQLDVDHVDGNHTNNDVSNLRTLCANCHRLKTQVNKDHLPKKPEIIIYNYSQLELHIDG